MYLYYLIVGAVFFAGLAMTVREGLWHNIMLFCNLALASVIAFGFYQPLTVKIDEASGGQFTYLLDIVAFWLLFGLSAVVLKTVGVTLSPYRVKFLHPLQQYLGPVFALACGALLACVTAVSLHLAPLPKDTLGGALLREGGAADSPSLINASPDLAFLGGARAFTAPAGLGGAGEFEPGPWVQDYADRRARFEAVMQAAKAAWELKAARSQSR